MNASKINPSPQVRAARVCRHSLLAMALAAVAVITAPAQSITPVWEYLINKLPSPLPILTNSVPYTTDIENGDGLSLMDCIGPMRRYDANRLLLGIRENGIDETQVHNTNLANAYPDRSLIWINPTNGAPMGLALNMGLFPVPLDSEASTNGGVAGSYYWSFDVSDDGYIYTGYENMILRYAPNGSGGIAPTPTVVFTLDQATATAAGISVAAWANYRWAHVRVRGAGADTKILAGGIGARGLWFLTTTDGATFTAGATMRGAFGNAAGNISNFIPDPTGTAPDEYAFFGGSFPGNSSGADTALYKAKAFPPYDNPANTFIADGGFAAESDPNTNSLSRYLRLFQGSCDAHPDVDYVVNYSAPAYNPTAVGGHKPGWLAIHNRTNGQFIASYELCVTGADEFLVDDQSSLFIGCLGSVSIYPLPDGTAEVLWTSEVFGYGRYIVGSPRYSRASSMAKNINTLWEQLQGQPNSLPIIDTDVSSNPVPGNGSSTMHVFSGLKKYDANRLLLAIRDNGINETVVHNTNLANAYPDRSLQWIDATTGKPLGTALVISGYGNIGDDDTLYMAFGVADDGVLYVGVTNTIRRYAPSGGGFAAPTIAYTLPGGTPQPAKTQFSEFRVRGSGASTVIEVAHRNWYGDSDRILTTTDGLTFADTETIPTAGGISSVVPDHTGTGDNVRYRTSYPSTSNGIDSTMNRYRQAGGVGPFFGDSFPVEQVAGGSITNSTDVIYRTYFLTDVQTLPGLDWVLAYSTPSFRTFDNGTVSNALRGASTEAPNYQPGWLAVHDQVTGEVRGLRKIDVTEALNVIPSTTAPPIDFYAGWFIYAIPQGGVELYPVLNANSELAGVEILWWSATYGIGRYYIDTPPTSNTALRYSLVNGKLQLDWDGVAQVEAASAVTGPYAPITGACEGPYTYNGTAPQFFRLRLQ